MAYVGNLNGDLGGHFSLKMVYVCNLDIEVVATLHYFPLR
jgi:hypothetical protein